MLVSAILGLVFVYGADAGYVCTTATQCNITCDNFVPKGYEFPNVSVINVQPPWIVVPVEDGSCYFYNQNTGENKDDYPEKSTL